MLESGFVRIYRSMLKWEWYDDANTMRVFFHLILTANYGPQKWHGINVERGQRVFSYSKLAKELHLSVQSTRTAINHLKSTGEITCEGTSEYSVVTIKNYEIYQQPTCDTTNDQQATNNPLTSGQQQWNKAKESNKGNKAKEEGQENMPGAANASSGRKVFISLILNDRSLYPVYEDQIPHWKELYPVVNVEQELRNMAGWCEANPSQRKTKGGINRFIIRWLAKTQDRGGNNGYGGKASDERKDDPTPWL